MCRVRLGKNKETVEGTSLFRFCLANSLKQFVKQLTRRENLLDLVISDLDGRIEVLPQISNHNMVLAVFYIGIPEMLVVKRIVYDYAKALWKDIQAEFLNFD